MAIANVRRVIGISCIDRKPAMIARRPRALPVMLA